MGCELLSGRQVKMCGAFHSHLVLSLDELEGKCLTKTYYNCKIYQMCKNRGCKLALKEYREDHLMTQV